MPNGYDHRQQQQQHQHQQQQQRRNGDDVAQQGPLKETHPQPSSYSDSHSHSHTHTHSTSTSPSASDMLSVASPVDGDVHRHVVGDTASVSPLPDAPTSHVVQGLKDYLVFRVKGRLPGRGGPEAFPWYHPDHVPSPAAFYAWRRDQCSRYHLPFGSLHDQAFWTHFVKVNYDESIHDRIRQDQHRYEDFLERTRISELQSAALGPTTPQHRVEWILCGVAEAIRRHPPLPSPHSPAANATTNATANTPSRNRKNLPAALYADRNKFHDEWHNYCRTQGSGSQNNLYDYVAYASHNPYSLYHRVKYGDYGSPHPYVPFAITNPTEFLRSQQLQRTEEGEAIAWIAERRRICSTQADLDRRAQQIQAQELEEMERARQPEQQQQQQQPSAALSTSPPDGADVVPVNISDEAVIDQEVEQPQAMKMGEDRTGDGQELPASVPAIAASAKAPEHPQTQAQPQPQLPPLLTPAPNVAAATSQSHPITVSILVPETLMPWIRMEIYHQLRRDHPEKLRYYEDATQRRLPWPHGPPTRGEGAPLVRLKPVVNLAAVATDDEAPWRANEELRRQFACAESAQAKACSLSGPLEAPRWVSAEAASTGPAPPPSFQLGNLYLSSCPGKKVRLTGAVRGRGAVCRDLGIDLVRFKALNVGTIVCCLSDAELAVIGVQWSSYVREADKLGLDLLRIPMVEGNCPTSHAAIDAWLDEIIAHCTLKGVNVLVHCRGGVGRAGTLAACWLIKMGLVDEFRPAAEEQARGHLWEGQEMMWQCLQVVRLRRSSKAIETAEQAHFIAQYGEHVLQRWRREHPREEPLEEGHRRRVEAYWARIRQEAQKWVEAEERGRAAEAQAEPQGRGVGQVQQAQGGPTPSSSTSTSSAQPAPALTPAPAPALYHSNVNAKHAATVPASANGGTNGANGSGSVASLASTSTSSSGSGSSPNTAVSASVSPTSTATATAAAAAAAPSYFPTQTQPHTQTEVNGHTHSMNVNGHERGRDGEPSRKRRNTLNMAGMAGMHLGDESAGGGGGVAASAAQAAAPRATNRDVKVGTESGRNRERESELEAEMEMEMDAFPVNGRRPESESDSGSGSSSAAAGAAEGQDRRGLPPTGAAAPTAAAGGGPGAGRGQGRGGESGR